MTSRQKATATLVVLLFILGMYEMTYYRVVDQYYRSARSTPSGEMLGRPMPTYRAGGKIAAFVFEPAHWLDTKLRPELWKP